MPATGPAVIEACAYGNAGSFAGCNGENLMPQALHNALGPSRTSRRHLGVDVAPQRMQLWTTAGCPASGEVSDLRFWHLHAYIFYVLKQLQCKTAMGRAPQCQ